MAAGRGQLSDCGTRFVWNAGFLRPKACPIELGPPFQCHPPVNELSQSLLKVQGVIRVNRRVAYLLYHGTADGSCNSERYRGSQAMGPRHYSVVKDPRRKRKDRDEPRAQESGAGVYGSPAGVSPQAAHSGEARVPESIIQEGKKGIRGLMSVFRKIPAVTDFSER